MDNSNDGITVFPYLFDNNLPKEVVPHPYPPTNDQVQSPQTWQHHYVQNGIVIDTRIPESALVCLVRERMHDTLSYGTRKASSTIVRAQNRQLFSVVTAEKSHTTGGYIQRACIVINAQYMTKPYTMRAEVLNIRTMQGVGTILTFIIRWNKDRQEWDWKLRGAPGDLGVIQWDAVYDTEYY